MYRIVVMLAATIGLLSCSSKPSAGDLGSAISAAVSRTSGNNISLRSWRLITMTDSGDGYSVNFEAEIVFNTNCRWMGNGAQGLGVFKTKPVSPDGKGAWPMYTFGELQKRPELLEGELVTPGTTKKVAFKCRLKKENGIWVASD